MSIAIEGAKKKFCPLMVAGGAGRLNLPGTHENIHCMADGCMLWCDFGWQSACLECGRLAPAGSIVECCGKKTATRKHGQCGLAKR